MQYSLLRRFGSVAVPVGGGLLSALGSTIYTAESFLLKGHEKEAPLFVTIEGSVTSGAGGDATSNITARACLMATAAAPSAVNDQLRIWGKGKFASEGDPVVMWLGAAPATGTGLYATFAIGATPHIMCAPYIGLRFSNSATAYTGGTFVIHNLSVWG